MAHHMNLTRVTTEHEQILRWADDHGAVPVRMKRAAREQDDPGALRFQFPEIGLDAVETLTWDQFFDEFEALELAFVYQEDLETGRTTTWNKLVRRDVAASYEEVPPGSHHTYQGRARQKSGGFNPQIGKA